MRRIWLLSVIAIGGCDEPENPASQRRRVAAEDDFPPGVVVDAAPSTLRRLDARQYRNTLRDVLGLGDADVAGIQLADDEGGIPSLLTVGTIDDVTGDLVAKGAHRKLLSCDANGAPDDACAASFITTLARKAFRRPATSDETQWLTGVYESARGALDFAASIDVLARVILESPLLVYRYEEGEEREGLPEGLLRLRPHELASRLSYLLWDSIPDDGLVDAAANGRLDARGLRAEADRLASDPKARTKVVQFVTDWAELDGSPTHVSIEEAVKDPTLFPNDNPALRAAVRRETEELVGRVWDHGGSVNELFTSREAFVNGPVAQLYGVTPAPAGDTWTWTALPADQRSGLATRAAFLLVFSNADIASPIRRGAVVFRQFMCTPFPPPPPTANDVQISGGVDPTGRPLSIREVVTTTTMTAECRSCHERLNPAGFPFARYDALGQWQNAERVVGSDGTKYDVAIDATGELLGSDVAGSVDGAVQLSEKLAQSRRVKDCLTMTAWQRAMGRAVMGEEVSSVDYVKERLATTGRIRDALAAMVETPAFRYVRKAVP
jgi:hypothetical protein